MQRAVLAVAILFSATPLTSPRQGSNLTGTITWKHDGGNRISAGSIEHHATMTINVNLKPDPSGLERAYVDDGSSYTYSASHVQTSSIECGVEYRWTETGSGGFSQEGAAIGVTVLGNEILLTAVGPYTITGTGGFPPCTPMQPLEPGNHQIGPGCDGEALSGNPSGQGALRVYDFTCSSLAGGMKTTVSGSLRIGPAVVKAVFGGPDRAVRGEPVILDGSNSEGENLQYTWTFTPKDCPPGEGGHRAAKREGPTPSVTFLCSMGVTLAVTDGRARDRTTVAVTVTPRPWKTEFTHQPTEGSVDGAESPVMNRSGWVGGQNACAIDPSADDHVLHPAQANGTWDELGYRLDQVRDPGGPFDGYWYVVEYMVRLERQTLINKHLLPGAVAVRTAKSFYQANQELKTDVRGYLAAVRAHEGLSNGRGVLGHSGLMQRELAKVDPARRVEQAFGAGPKEKLRATVDAMIGAADVQICKAAQDPLPLIWQGKLAVARYGADEWLVLPDLFMVGGPSYPRWACSPVAP